MKITFIDHSGFAVETEHYILIFDYYKGAVPNFPSNKKLLVFSSHAHGDHYNPMVLSWQDQHPDIHYYLSSDIKVQPTPQITFLDDNVMWHDEDVTIETLDSTDEGVAFIVTVDGHVIYHAGDLHWWTWVGEETPEEYEQMTARFQFEMSKIQGRHFDLAFMILDPRQAERYSWGMNYFMQTVDAPVVFPMHCWGDYSIIEKYCSNPAFASYADKIMKITSPGQVFEIE